MTQPGLLTVPPEARGERLDQYLTRALPELTRARVQSLLEQGLILLAGSAAKPSRRLAGGESLSVTLPAPRASATLPQALPLDILFEDKSLVVLNKAAGMVVHPAAGHWEGTVVNALLHRVQGLTGVGGELRPGIVHRLDKDTSGCLVVAKTEAALYALQRAFKAHQVQKTYLALVSGNPPERARIETLYGRHPVHRKRFTGKVKEGKPALTEYRIKQAFEGAALLEVSLHTGRTHQIRVHLAEAGFPLLGDSLYGRPQRSKGQAFEAAQRLGRQGLHAWRLAFPHPRTSKPVAFEAPLPEDFRAALTLLSRR